MTGDELKLSLIKTGFQLKDIAERLSMSQQNFSAALTVKDIKTGFLEKICNALDLEMTYFYPPKHKQGVTVINTHAKGNAQTAIAEGNGDAEVSTGVSEEALMMLLRQNQQILDMLNKK